MLKETPLKIRGQRDFGHFKQSLFHCVIPVWSAGIQVDMDVSGSILVNLDAGYPCRHDEVRTFIFCGRESYHKRNFPNRLERALVRSFVKAQDKLLDLSRDSDTVFSNHSRIRASERGAHLGRSRFFVRRGHARDNVSST